MARVDVALEIGAKRVFAVAVEWPGWARGGRSEEEALEALLAYADRYARALARRRVEFKPPRGNGDLRVIERLTGGGATDFGVPAAAPSADDRPLSAREADRQLRLLKAAWAAFDSAAAAAEGVELRKGPRGGGRDLAKMAGHVLEAEDGYVHQLCARRPKGEAADVGARMKVVRDTAVKAFEALARGEDPEDPSGVRKRWRPRYYARRSAWHALDHAWEIEDRAEG